MHAIGLAGPSGAGKSTAVQYLLRRGWASIEIARPIKVAVMSLYDLTEEEAFSDELKDVVISRLGKTPRQLQLEVGRIWREVDPHGVMRKTIDRLRSLRRQPNSLVGGVVVSAVRLNEIEAIPLRAEGAVIVHIERPGYEPNASETTEQGVSFRPGDARLLNPGDGTYGFHRNIDSLLGNLQREVA
jgi:hypothetical protein